jgi:hypothetical protein
VTRRLVLVALLVPVVLAGCAVPRWVPLLGKSDEPKARAPRTPNPAALERRRAERAAEQAAARKPVDDSIADRVVAVVNNDAITWGELLEAIVVYRQENRERAGPSDDELARQFLNRLIDTRLQLQEAKDIVVEDGEVAEELADIMKKVGAKDEAELDGMVRASGSGSPRSSGAR